MIKQNTIVQAGRRRGFISSLMVRGRDVVTDTRLAGSNDPNQMEQLRVIPQDQPIAVDGDGGKLLRQEKMVYVMIVGLAGSVKDPRTVGRFTECDSQGKTNGRTYKVINFDEKVSDQVTWTWFCEAEREVFS
jgi:hypothetical protein